MVDTTTTVLAFVKQTVGGNRNTWGAILNTNFDMIEEAICGVHSVSTTGGTTTLTQAQARKRYIEVSGTLSSDATIEVPDDPKEWVITNVAPGSFAVLVKTAAGSPVSVPFGTVKTIICNSGGAVFRPDSVDVGQMAFFGNTAVPPGWLECDGSAISRAGIGLDLFNKVSTTWGVGNGSTTFNIPDAKTAGKFLRSRTASVALGTAQSDQNKAHTHGVSITSGTQSADHTHAVNIASGTESADHTHAVNIAADSQGDHAHTISITDTRTWATASNVVGSAGGSKAATAGGSAWSETHSSVVSSTGGAISGSSNTTGAHVHTVSGNSAGRSAAHTHIVSGTTATTSANHTHLVSGTTNSDGGTDARPTNLSAILCIRL